MAVPNVVAEALERFKLSVESDRDQRKRELDDLAFQVPEQQWSSDIQATRSAQIVNDVPIPARPMLSIPKLDQPIQLVLNQEKSARLGVEVHPLSDEATDDTAEVLQGLYRRIEVDSRANLARSWAFERAVKAGRGAYRVLKEYDPDGGHPSDQKIVIKRLLHQESARMDPFAQEPDSSDAEWGMVSEWYPAARFQRCWPKADLNDLSDGEFDQLLETAPDWLRNDEAGKAYLVVEYFRKVYRARQLVALADGSSAYDDAIPQGKQRAADGYSREEQDYTVQWSKLSATEELESGDWDGRHIPIILTIGRELIPFDAERRWTGIIGPNKDAAKGFNYAASGLLESAALEPKAPFDVDPEEIEGYESWWNQANTRNFPYLPRKKFLHGQLTGPIGRIQADTSKMQVNTILLQNFGDFLHAGTGAFEPSLGQSSPNAKTKGGTLALQQQHDQGNSNWLDNLAEISLTYEARVVLDLIPHVYDRPGRIARIFDKEDNPRTVMLNQAFVMGPNKRPQPAPPQGPPGMQPQQPGPPQGMPPMSQAGQQPAPPKVMHYDLTKGRYGVTVSIGKAYKSRVEEGADKLGQLFQAEPQLFSILGDLYLKFQDFPGHLEAAERMKKMLPPPLQDQGDQQATEQQVAQLQGHVKQIEGQLQQAGQIIETKQVEQQAKITATKIQASAQLQMHAMDNATKIAVARITAAKASLDAAKEDSEEALALGQQQQHEAVQNAHDRAHEVAMAALEHQHQLAAAQQAHEQATAQAEQGGQIDAGLADQGQSHALEQGQQAADLAPEPSTNGNGG